MKEKFNFKNINLSEDFRDTVKKSLDSKIRESASLPKLGRVQLGKGYKKPFAENKRLTEMRAKDNFSFSDFRMLFNSAFFISSGIYFCCFEFVRQGYPCEFTP